MAEPNVNADAPKEQTANAPVTGDLQQSQTSAPAAVQPPITGMQPATAAAAPPEKRGIIGAAEQGGKHVLSEIFQTLAGGKKKEWTVPADGGPPVATYRDLKPGEMARGILAAAITGLASGYDPANRGRGPAMSSAFSAGFRGEDEARKEKAAKEENEAQQQFKNQGIAEERKLALQRNAREQQESLERSATHEKLMQEHDLNIKNIQMDTDHKFQEYNLENEKRWNDLQTSGARPVQGEAKDGFATHDEAVAWANRNPKIATAAPPGGQFNTVYIKNPNNGRWFALETPVNEDAQIKWRGVLTDDKGQPILDKNGKKQIDPKNPLYNPKRQTIIPNEPMSGSDFRRRNDDSISLAVKMENADSLAEERAARAQARKKERDADQAMKVARQHLTDSGGDLTKVDKFGNPVVTPGDREVLLHDIRSDYADAASVFSSAIKQLSTMDKSDPEYSKISALADQAKDTLSRAMNLKAAFDPGVDNVAIVTQNAIKNHRNADTGKIDIDAWKKAAGPDMPKALVDKVVSNLERINKQLTQTATTSTGTSTGIRNVQFTSDTLAALKNAGKSVDEIGNKIRPEIDALKTPKERADYIDKLNLPQEAKMQLMKDATVNAPLKTTPVLMPNGLVVAIPEDNLREAIDAGGKTLTSSEYEERKAAVNKSRQTVQGQ